MSLSVAESAPGANFHFSGGVHRPVRRLPASAMSAHMPAPPPQSASGGWTQPLRPPPPPASSSSTGGAAASFQHPHAAAAGDFTPQPQVAMYNPANAAPVNNGPLLEQPGASNSAAAQDSSGAYHHQQQQQPYDPSQGQHSEQQAMQAQYEPQAQGYENQQYDPQAYADYYAQQQQQQQPEDQQAAYGDYYQQQNYYDQSGYYWGEQNQQQQPYEEVAQTQEVNEAPAANGVANGLDAFEAGASGGGEVADGQQPATGYFNPANSTFGAEHDKEIPDEEGARGEPEKYPERERRAPSIGGALEAAVPIAVGQEAAPPLPPVVPAMMPDVARDSSTKQAPDILLLPSNQFVPPPSSDRNLFMQTGELNANDEAAAAAAAVVAPPVPASGASTAPPPMMGHAQPPPPPLLQPPPPPMDQVREPVDGGNEEVEVAAAAAPVVGAHALGGGGDRDEDDATDVDIPMDRLVLGENLPPPPPPPPVQERVVPGEPPEQPPPQNLLVMSPPMASSSPMSRPPVAQQSLTPILPPPSLAQPELRSETVGSDRRDESVMGPTQDSGPTAGKREEGTGADADDAGLPSVAVAAAAVEQRPFDGRNEESDGDRSRYGSI